jgi:uncharacterized protein
MVMNKMTIPARDGEPLHATWHETVESTGNRNPVVILCHGFTGNREEWGRFPAMADALADAGIDAIAFDFTGSGENARKPVSLARQVDDLVDVFAWAKQQGYDRIGTLGLSFGGLTSLLAPLPERTVAVFWAPAFRMKSALGNARLILKLFSSRITGRQRKINAANGALIVNASFYDGILKSEALVKPTLQQLAIPTLIVQGLADRTVRPARTRAAFNLMPVDEQHKLVEIPGAGHGFDGDQLASCVSESCAWFRQYL